ncbi:MAG TPA: 2-oxo acid dehydrogenase subunit E2 [Steroidobacteraceae bacterium]|jgi:2-oxoglutarate dehydrogenase E2 component (dihydrolipoamide succinyltransferase)|nr:2-oxo acid dehydrogenase subunit E2 [Steroidobacteraceae bacterium]
MTQVADVLVPPNAEGTRATVLRWCKEVGDTVVKDEPLVELETDKVTVEIPAPAAGILIEVLKEVNAEVVPDEVLARLSLGSEAAARPTSAVPLTSALPPISALPPASAVPLEPKTGDRPVNSPDAAFEARGSPQPLSPAVRRLLEEHSLAAADIAGTGRDGRITAQDVIRHAADATAKRAPARSPEQTPIPPGGTRIPHTAIRRRVAEHMARSLMEAPHVTTLFEADLTRVLAHRARHAAAYESRGVRLTLTAYFVSACVQALRVHREVNATFHPDALELHEDMNIGVGTALGNKGLIVPVIHRAQGLNLFGLAQRLGQLVEAARAGKLSPEDVRGGTFTISNHGVGGSLLAAPIIINQPQVAILGAGKVERRVVVVEVDGVEAVSVRSKCYLTLTIDHRALDAFQANAFLGLVVSTLEQWPTDDS